MGIPPQVIVCSTECASEIALCAENLRPILAAAETLKFRSPEGTVKEFPFKMFHMNSILVGDIVLASGVREGINTKS